MNFFIISLPRCGTAWLANALTWGNSFCYHEGIYGHDNMDDYADMLGATNAEFVGDSDTGLALILPWLYAQFPQAKYVFVRRDVSAVRHSLVQAGFSTHQIPEIQRSIEWGIKNIDALVIDFADLFTDPHQIWEHIGLPDFPSERFEMLRYMKVDDSEQYLNIPPINYSQLMAGAA